MKRKVFVVLILVFIFVGILFYFSGSSSEQVCFESGCFDVEVARSSEARAKGLMFREALGVGQGMLFVFPESGEYNFWMKNTFISLDMIWISEELEVVHVERDVPPCDEDPCPSYGFNGNSKYVLEVNSYESLEIESSERVSLEL